LQQYNDQTRQTERADERQALRPFLRQYLEGKGIDTRKNFRCLSPSHPDRHPSAYYTTGHRVLCRACGAQFDIFDLIALEMGRPAADRAVFEEVRRRYGQNFSFSPAAAQSGSSSGRNSAQPLDWNDTITAEQPPPPAPPEDFTEFFRECAARISSTDYPQRRGLTAETCTLFGLGYAPAWRHPKAPPKVDTSPRLIIPTSRTSYTARDVRDIIPEEKQQFKNQKVGRQNLYLQHNLYKPGAACVIVEGELDALSIAQSGGRACALRSITNAGQLLRLLECKPPAVPLALLLDADTPGQTAQAQLVQGLQRLRLPYYVGTMPEGCKDANDALRLCPDRLKYLVERLRYE
jgi:replicative DNA helicase